MPTSHRQKTNPLTTPPITWYVSRQLRVASMFAGIGGICHAFNDAGAKVMWANELDKHACITYRLNFGTDYLVEQDIKTVDYASVPDFDILTAGFPCQPFSIAGDRKGFDDERGNLFFSVIHMLKAKNPQVFLLENVKGLLTHDKGRTYQRIGTELQTLGYTIRTQILSAHRHGNLPQTRERVFIVGFRNKDDAHSFNFPGRILLETTISDLINYGEQDECYYYHPSHPSYDLLNRAITQPYTIYQLRRNYVRENKSQACPTLTANMGTGGNNVPLIRDAHGIRKITPQEALRFQGFSSTFTLPADIAKSHLYKQIGNSVAVPVVQRIAHNILSTLQQHHKAQ